MAPDPRGREPRIVRSMARLVVLVMTVLCHGALAR